MRTHSNAHRPARRGRFVRAFQQDTYKTRGKLREPTVCTGCGVVYHKGRWQWPAAPATATAPGIAQPPASMAHTTLCPACRRAHDRVPGGYLTLRGPFLTKHRNEIVQLVRNIGEREKLQHPLRRIMALEPQDDSILVTTTQMEMARSIGDAIHHAYQGELDYHYAEEASILRVRWQR